jgi:hypothetical protein
MLLDLAITCNHAILPGESENEGNEDDEEDTYDEDDEDDE